MSDVTLLLESLRGGDGSVLDRVMPRVYKRVWTLVRAWLTREGQAST